MTDRELAIGYIRCSTEEQAKSGLGLAAQKAAIELYCTMRGIKLHAIMSDPGHSGGTRLAVRPNGQKLIDALALPRPRIRHVVIAKLDRAFRSTQDALETVAEWQKRKIALHVVDMGGNSLDASTAVGWFVLTMLVSAAELERNLCAERTSAAMRTIQKRGFSTGQIPFGYRGEPMPPDEFGKVRTRVVEDTDQQAALAWMRKSREDRVSFREIVESLNERGVKDCSGETGKWTINRVFSILKSAASRDEKLGNQKPVRSGESDPIAVPDDTPLPDAPCEP